jgi:hypothetical protein
VENIEIQDEPLAWERAKADARLIAAAPDMLAALQEIVNLARTERTPVSEALFTIARDALARVSEEIRC